MNKRYLRQILLVCSIIAVTQSIWLFPKTELLDRLWNGQDVTKTVSFAFGTLVWPAIIFAIWFRTIQLRKTGLHALALLDVMATVFFVAVSLIYREPATLQATASVLYAIAWMLPYHIALAMGIRNRSAFT